MGKPVARFKDLCTGHYCYPPRPAISGSPDVFVNKRPLHRVKDEWAVHCCGTSCHDSVLVKGSRTVFVNKRPAGRIGDPIACGSFVMTGSENVSAG